jgi:hypothetical protein
MQEELQTPYDCLAKLKAKDIKLLNRNDTVMYLAFVDFLTFP